MALNAAKVLIGTADQQNATGAVLSGAPLSTIPTTFAEAETAIAALTASGYVSEDGVELGNDMSTADIREWNRNIVRKLLESYDGTLTFSLIQQDEESWKQAVGASNVGKTAATTTHGEQLRIALGAHLPDPQAWAFKIKDGDARAIIVVPNGQVTALDAITFNATSAIALPITVSAYDDGTGNSIYIFTDDGVATA